MRFLHKIDRRLDKIPIAKQVWMETTMTVKWIAGTTDLYDRSQEQKQMRRAKDHLYRELENSAAWPIIDEAIEKLVRNKDLIEQTDRRYVVGFVLKALSDNGLLKKQARD